MFKKLLLALGLVLCTTTAFADDGDMQSLVRELTREASDFTGYPIPHDSIVVAPLPREEFTRRFCTKNCATREYMQDGIVYTIEGVDFFCNSNECVLDRSILLHEIVHVFQLYKSKGRKAADERESALREAEAYSAQNKWLKKHGSGIEVYNPFLHRED